MAARGDWAAPLRLVASELAWTDLTVANLECALTHRFAPPDDPYTLRFLSFPEAITGLQLSGIDAVSLANNHSMDFGPLALADTRQALAEAGILSFGAGEDLAAALAPAELALGSSRVALLGFDGISADWYGATPTTAGTAPLLPDLVERAIRDAARRADIVIPFFHWGVEYTLVPTETQRALAYLALDSGATLVVGSHPHWVQGIEWYHDKPIFYSLGNFVFDQEWSSETKQGLILHLWFAGTRLARYQLVPVVIEEFHRPRLATTSEALTILARVRESSRRLRSSV
jgi:poly-gamma-glutamate synthesis protein (capsule biosynthesis protein)